MSSVGNFDKLAKDCCICGGLTAIWTTGSAYITVNGKEYRVFYHAPCLNDQTKDKVTEILNKMAEDDRRQ